MWVRASLSSSAAPSTGLGKCVGFARAGRWTTHLNAIHSNSIEQPALMIRARLWAYCIQAHFILEPIAILFQRGHWHEMERIGKCEIVCVYFLSQKDINILLHIRMSFSFRLNCTTVEVTMQNYT